MVRLVRLLFVLAAAAVGAGLGLPTVPSVLAATTVAVETPLLAEPAVSAAVVIVLPVGAKLAIQGAPQNDFYRSQRAVSPAGSMAPRWRSTR